MQSRCYGAIIEHKFWHCQGENVVRSGSPQRARELEVQNAKGGRFNAESAGENGYNRGVQNENGEGRKFAFDTYYV
jgi:hypothetical protein